RSQPGVSVASWPQRRPSGSVPQLAHRKRTQAMRAECDNEIGGTTRRDRSVSHRAASRFVARATGRVAATSPLLRGYASRARRPGSGAHSDRSSTKEAREDLTAATDARSPRASARRERRDPPRALVLGPESPGRDRIVQLRQLLHAL